MSDAVELMEFWPVDADENIGFVAADSDFQLWLLDGIGISFDDISYSVIDGPDNSGIYDFSEVETQISIHHGENDEKIPVEQSRKLCHSDPCTFL